MSEPESHLDRRGFLKMGGSTLVGTALLAAVVAGVEPQPENAPHHLAGEGTVSVIPQWGGRYYDVSPWYGFGLAERRFGHFLHNQKREDYVISSKVGKLFKAARNNDHAKYYPLSDSPNNISFDDTADGVRRSIEDSFQRLGISDLDIAFV